MGGAVLKLTQATTTKDVKQTVNPGLAPPTIMAWPHPQSWLGLSHVDSSRRH